MVRLHSHYHAKVKDLFDQIVPRDMKWAHHFISKMKNASKQWVVKAKRERSASKIYLAVFWDNQGVLLEEYTAKEVSDEEDLI